MSTNANLSMTGAAVLGTVTTAAVTISNTISTANRAVGMLNTIVNDAADNQQLRSIANKAAFKENLIRQMARQQTEMDISDLEFAKKSPEHNSLYKANLEKYSALLNPNMSAPKT